MRVLWLCNFMLPMIAEKFHLGYTNKEGWVSGLASMVLERREESGIELGIAFPAPEELCSEKGQKIVNNTCSFMAFGFLENTMHPHCYDTGLEERLRSIVVEFQPDVVHCFGTEYPHTLAMCRIFSQKDRLLVGIQGLCAVYANTYFANLPQNVVKSTTLRDILKRDSLPGQQAKFEKRGAMEKDALQIAGNITGRTDWDRHYAHNWNPGAKYYVMNETLRESFYQGAWREEECIPHSIFVSQGDYPIKGLHYLLLALPKIRQKYPDVQVFVAGDCIVGNGSFWKRWKLSAYGKYLRKLLREGGLWDHVTFLGRLNAQEMKERYLKSHLFVCCSTIENSPNSLGEAMLLGLPCVSADVGGIPSLFTDGEDGLLYKGYRSEKNSYDRVSGDHRTEDERREENANALADAVIRMWSDPDQMQAYCEHAREHAAKTHDREVNYRRLIEVYTSIVERAPSSR